MGKLIDQNGVLTFRFKSGGKIEDAVTSDKLNAMVDAINGSMILSVVNGFFKFLNPGRSLICGGGGGNTVSVYPFRLKDASTRTTKKARVYRGTVNGIAPDGFSDGDNPVYIIDLLGSAGKVWTGISVDADNPNDVTGRWVDTGADTPADTGTEKYREIGSFSVIDGGLFLSNSVTTSLGYRFCGETAEWWSA